MEILETAAEKLNHPFDLHWNQYTLKSVLVCTILYGMGIGIFYANKRNYRRGEEYGSARWGNAKDIEPYVDDKFENNILFTKTERLTMNGRPPNPKYARNKNVLVIGGSGSGKTRFYVKPNLMQMHSSYCVTDPKGTIVIECGKMLEENGYEIKILNTRGRISSFSIPEESSAEDVSYQQTHK